MHVRTCSHSLCSMLIDLISRLLITNYVNQRPSRLQTLSITSRPSYLIHSSSVEVRQQVVIYENCSLMVCIFIHFREFSHVHPYWTDFSINRLQSTSVYILYVKCTYLHVNDFVSHVHVCILFVLLKHYNTMYYSITGCTHLLCHAFLQVIMMPSMSPCCCHDWYSRLI